MRIVAKTDTGLKRTNNQDSYAAGELPGSVAWAVVCDGMGGVAGGNLASSTAVKLISERISSSYRPGMSAGSIRNMLMSAISAANIEVYEMSRQNPELNGMGTTVVVSIVANETVYVALYDGASLKSVAPIPVTTAYEFDNTFEVTGLAECTSPVIKTFVWKNTTQIPVISTEGTIIKAQ